MAKIVIQNQTSPTTPDCGFTAMYVNCITWLPTFKRDDGTECSFVLSDWSWCAWDMLKCVYDPTCVYADVFAMDNMKQWTCKQYVTCDQVNCWNSKANACDIPTDVCQLCNSSNYVSNATCDLCNYYLKCETYTKEEVECMVSNFWGFCVVETLPESWCTNLIYLRWPIGCWDDKYEEWIYNSCWTLIWETSPDLSNYAKCCDIPDTSDLAKCCDIPDTSDFVQCCDVPDFDELAKCCDIPDVSNFVQCCDVPDLCNVAHICDIPTDNCQLSNWCWYTKCTWDMQKCLYDPNNCATDVYCMDNMVDGTSKVAMTTTERTKLSWISWCNTWDETEATIKCKLWITTLNWCNTWDETTATIKSKLWSATCADDWYLKACDFANFYNKQDELISWCNIITINGCTILRCWNIDICDFWWDMKACMYDPQGCCTDAFNRANHYGCQSYTTITWLGTASTRDVWTNCGNVVVVWNNWKISSDILPAQDVVDVCVFPSEAAMLSWCTATRWDMAIRSDLWTTFVFSWWCYCCLCDWTELPTPASPVTSVNSKIWDVCLTTDDIDDSNSSNKYVTAAEKTCWCWKADPYVSWCTIKTINWCSILWCWDLAIWNTITCVNGKTGNVCLTADDIPDTGTWHLFVSQTEKNCWNCKIDCADAITDNCQLCNSCGYIVAGCLCNYAQCCDIPINNCQLINWCGYVDQGYLTNFARCCDMPDFSQYACHDEVPTNNCELINWCCYVTSVCLSWYMQCCDMPDVSDLAHCEDIPTDNCQLDNGCCYAKVCDIPDTSCLIHKWMNYCVCNIDIMNWDDPSDWDHRASINAELWFQIFNWTWCAAYNSSSISSRWWCYTFDKCACGIAQMCDIPNVSCMAQCCDVNTKTFYLADDCDLTTAQAIYDWYAAGNNPIIIYENNTYNIVDADSCWLDFEWVCSDYSYVWSTNSTCRAERLCIPFSSWCVTNIVPYFNTISTFLEPWEDYECPYMPTYDGSPATKAYVDCSICNTWVCNKVTCWDEICICCDIICSRTNTNAAWFGIYWCWDWTVYWRGWITRPNDCVYSFDKCDNGIAQMCDIPQEIDTWLWRVDHIDCSECCILCEWKQLIVEWRFTIDWELINEWIIYII